MIEFGLRMVSATRGELGGLDVLATGDAGVLDVRFRLWPTKEAGAGTLRVTTTLRDISGRPVQDVLPAVRLLAHCRPPNELKWMEDYGVRVLAAHAFKEEMAPVPDGLQQFLEDLSIVQNHVRGVVRVPHDMSASVVRAVAEAAELLRKGEVRGTWADVRFQLADQVTRKEFEELIAGGGAILIESEMDLELEGVVYSLGRVQQIAASARLDDHQPEARSVRLVPGDDPSFIQRLKPVSEE